MSNKSFGGEDGAFQHFQRRLFYDYAINELKKLGRKKG